jgi:acyl phosphate:glycerol-3-phosphate acyltransferase
MTAILTVCASYLIGSIPFSYLVARAFGVSDVRRVGSGNVGATNVLRTAGRPAGVLAFLLDAGKGALAAALAGGLAPGDRALPALAALAAVAGHMYPVWLRFHGGKGVATGLGAFAPIAPVAAGIAVLAFAVVAAATRYVSLGSIAGAVALAALAFAEHGPGPVAACATVTAALIVFRHRSNLRRIRAHTERRVGQGQGVRP